MGYSETVIIPFQSVTATAGYVNAPVNTVFDLPTGVFNGEVRLVMSEERFYYWDGIAWQATADGAGYMGQPVMNYVDLPTGDFLGETRLVISEGEIYFWDGSTWQLLQDAGENETADGGAF